MLNTMAAAALAVQGKTTPCVHVVFQHPAQDRLAPTLSHDSKRTNTPGPRYSRSLGHLARVYYGSCTSTAYGFQLTLLLKGSPLQASWKYLAFSDWYTSGPPAMRSSMTGWKRLIRPCDAKTEPRERSADASETRQTILALIHDAST